MILKSLKLSFFRNIESFAWSPHEKANLITGLNAQGKTNLLEAIYLLGTTKPFRHGNHEEQIQENAQASVVKAVIEKENPQLEKDLEVRLHRGESKQVKLNGKRLTPFSKIFGEFSVVLFVPEDLQMVKSGPAARRFFLDLEISQASPEYLHSLQKYQHILKQRNAAMRMLSEGNSTIEALEVFTEPLIQAGSEVISYRVQALKDIEPLAAKVQARVSQDTEHLKLTYNSSLFSSTQKKEDVPVEIGEISELYRKRLEDKARLERIRSTTLVGPHRDDMDIFINGRPARGYASQGQQRTAALALKLAEVHYLKEKLGENPVLLLDDVLSELDLKRQKELLGLLDESVQTFITSTHAEDLSYHPGQVMTVSNGQITPSS